jgi:AraC-like DNA-binding protein
VDKVVLAENNSVDVVVVDDFHEWTRLVSKWFVPLEVTSHHRDTFHGRVRTRTIGDVFISEITATEHQVERTPLLIAHDDKPYFKVSLQLDGASILMQDNREAVLAPGDIAVYDTNKPYTLVFDGDFRSLVVMFPHSLLDLPAETISQLTATRISGEDGLAKLVGPFLSQLAHNMDTLSGHSATRLMHNTVDLVATVLHSQLDADAMDRVHSHRSQLLADVHAYIDEHLGDPGLSPSEIAAAAFISTRHLHGIFKEQGVTVSAWIRSRRLELCRRDFMDPLLAHKPVSSIAARRGFADASHFSRLFRATFGQAPSGFRDSARLEFRTPAEAA